MSDSIGYMLNDAARLFRRAFDARTRDLGVTSLQWRIVAHLSRKPGLQQGQLAERLEVQPITLSRMVDRLTESGLVERRPNPDDRRAWQLHLTDKAMPLVSELRSRAEIIIEEALDGLAPEERKQLDHLVGRVLGNLSRKEQEAGA